MKNMRYVKNMRRLLSAGFLLAGLLPALLAGCGQSAGSADGAAIAYASGPYASGTYVGVSGEDDQGAYGEVTLAIDGGKITDCAFDTWQKDGTVKDENYGKVNGEISNQSYYDKAQLAVEAMKQYARQLVETQRLEDVDAVSGATIAYEQFGEAVANALGEASKASE
ncbi:MAG: FMN-binding protein [Clostridiales bacterium]|jgi:major membrane immunogen (membrane-anchored lipoprotein)|nr:FMN-binding protein [Clostridiales bacterium]